jgi:hypothetical protein
MLVAESDPLKRDSMCIPLSAFGRSIDAQVPTNARVYLAGMLGPEKSGNLGYFYFLTYYLVPREVAISLGQPPTYQLGGVAVGHDPTNYEELAQVGYDLVLQPTPDGRWESRALKPMPPMQPKVEPIAASDGLVAFLLPLAVALAGTRLVRLLFKELENVLSLGELLACGLAVGIFFLTQATLGLRMASMRMEYFFTWAIMLWAAVELVLLFRQKRTQLTHFHPRQLWWLLMIPAGLILWCLFRLAGTEGLLEFDAVAFWALKGKIFYSCAGPELWHWFNNPTLAYAHLDYPLTAPLLHTLTYGALGHVNEFVTKFWNVWMLLLLGAAALGAGRFPQRKPWLIAAVAIIVVLAPMSVEFARTEGGTIPMFFFTVISSLQLALGMAEKSPGRIRLGLLLLMATAMVKFEGIVLLGFWGILLLLDRDSRAAFWPLNRIGLAGLLAVAGWVPYLIFRLHHPVPHPESGWLGELLKNFATILTIAPMTCLAFLSRRFFNSDFANWTSTDNAQAAWSGKWIGLESLIDPATLGLGWLCLLVLVLAWFQGGKIRWTVLRLALVFVGFALFIGLVWSTTHSNPVNYTGSLAGSERITGGRYLYPVMMSWFVAGFVMLVRTEPEKKSLTPESKPQEPKPNRKPRR